MVFWIYFKINLTSKYVYLDFFPLEVYFKSRHIPSKGKTGASELKAIFSYIEGCVSEKGK